MTNMPADALLARANVLGVGVHAVDMFSAVDIIRDAMMQQQKGFVCATGVHGVMEAQRHPDLRAIFSRALLVVPDGMPTVWVGRLQGLSTMRRVFGPDLMLAVIGDPSLEGCSHFLYGGDPGVAQELKASLMRRFPNARIVGTYTPPFRSLTAREEGQLYQLVDSLRPQIVWIGLSTPKQERFMAQYLPRLNTTLMIGVGAAFDFHTGRLTDSPEWIKTFGLQWLHRLCQEPRRLWKRYLLNVPLFLINACLQLMSVRRYEIPHHTQSKNGTTSSSGKQLPDQSF